MMVEGKEVTVNKKGDDYLCDISAAFGNCANSRRLVFSKTPSFYFDGLNRNWHFWGAIC
jgi:hypothetical protein